MVLVDTSVWIDHFRKGNHQLVYSLNEGDVVIHPFIIGELACGDMKNRTQILTLLHDLPQSVFVNHEEILLFIENKKLLGKSLGYIDVCILASTILSDLTLWTLDKKLNTVAALLNVNYTPA